MEWNGMERDVPMKEFGCFSHDPRDILEQTSNVLLTGAEIRMLGGGDTCPLFGKLIYFSKLFM